MYRFVVKESYALLVLIIILAVNFSAFGQTPSEAPPAPNEEREMSPGRGFIPPPMDLSHLTGQNSPAKLSRISAPAQYDCRAQGFVTSIKNQSTCGSCYAFASLANFESKILINGGSAYDFSENNAKECNWHDRSCNGGSFYDLVDLFSKTGTVLETCDPYVPSDVSCATGCVYQKTLLDWRIISSGAVPSTVVLQNYIYANGPVYTTLYAGDDAEPSWNSEFNSYDGSYTMYHPTAQSPNHAVLIVGWDDTLTHAGGTGAWIVKNSWGTGWGGTCGYGAESGYFTIAYGSANIGMWSSFVNDYQDYDASGVLMYHDEGGWITQYGYGYTYAWGMCKFVPTEDINVTRVEFGTNDVTTDVDVYLYDDFDGSSLSNLLAFKLDTSFSEAGYHSVAFTTPVSVSSGDDIYAAVRINNNSYTSPIVADTGFSAAQTTYLSLNGGAGNWYDLGSGMGDDVAIRIRGTLSLAQGVDDEESLTPYRWELSNNFPNPFNPVTTIDYSLAERTYVDISVFNLLGQKINTLVSETKPAGPYSTFWNGLDYSGRSVASGVYFYRINTDEFIETKKMILLK